MMGRNRMVDDGFWGDPDLADLTIDERCTLLLFLTCPQSNVIGVYRLIWRQVGAGSGWTHDQILNAAKNLKNKGCIDLEESSGWVWVKEWWKHNSINGAFTGNVAKKAKLELLQVPVFWRTEILAWIDANDYEGACKPLVSSLQGAGSNPTTTDTPIPITTTIADGGGEEENIEDLIEAAVWMIKKTGKIRSDESGLRVKVRSRIKANGPNPEDLRTLAKWRAEQTAADQRDQAARVEALRREKASQDSVVKAAKITEAQNYYEALEIADQENLLILFRDHLINTNNFIFEAFRKQKLNSEIVKKELWKFILETRLELEAV